MHLKRVVLGVLVVVLMGALLVPAVAAAGRQWEGLKVIRPAAEINTPFVVDLPLVLKTSSIVCINVPYNETVLWNMSIIHAPSAWSCS